MAFKFFIIIIKKLSNHYPNLVFTFPNLIKLPVFKLDEFIHRHSFDWWKYVQHFGVLPGEIIPHVAQIKLPAADNICKFII